MRTQKETSLAPRRLGDPFGLLRQMASELDRVFDEPFWRSFRGFGGAEPAAWMPDVDVFEKNNQLVTRIDLPGLKKEDIKVEVSEGQLTISGERKREAEEKKEDFYRCEREYGSFFRAVPLPAGVKLEDVKASFADGVLEVAVPLPAKPAVKTRKVEILEPAKPKAA